MKAVWGIMAHVDAGKTTLSEAILYNSGKIASIGRVDHGDAFLDTNEQEKNRGITIFSKPAIIDYKGEQITLLDTPGHVDFATEAERAIFALDYAILLISGTDGVQAHTKTIFKLLLDNKIPTLIFINKTDMPEVKITDIVSDLKMQLSDKCILANDYEAMALSDEETMEEFLENDSLSSATVSKLINSLKVYPVYHGSALKNHGVEDLMEEMIELSSTLKRTEEFGGRIYKVESLGRDTRLSFMKVAGGSLAVKTQLENGEKVNELRLYSGEKYIQVDSASAGDVVALVGPKETFAGLGLGFEKNRPELSMTPVLSYELEFLDDTVPKLAYQKISALNDEDPSLGVCWDEKTQHIKMNLMGEVQTEILVNRIKEELGYQVEFKESGVLYKETIAGSVEGVGHFEPLRHYAEVHLLMEPMPQGSGIIVESNVSVDSLSLNFQRLIETHILEKEHIGTSIGAPVTDIKYTIIGGKSHIKHTEGGDFREATYRAIRQGLTEAGTIILEPYYRFEMLIPTEAVGRAMTDVETMSGSFEAPEDIGGISRLRGSAPAVEIRNYSAALVTYTKGEGRLTLVFDGYKPCHNTEQVMEAYNYNSEVDMENPASSVFCSHGAATIIPWNEVKEHCHVPCFSNKEDRYDTSVSLKRMNHSEDEWLDPDEIDKILAMATHSNQGKNPKKGWHYGDSRPRRVDSDYVYKAPKELKPKEKYLLVDGYNLIYAWPELKEVLDVNLDGARGKLLDILSNYKAMTDYNVIAVFDAYRVKGHPVEASDYLNIHQVFTAEAQTADAYIERFTHEHGKKYDITVVTSDGLEQVIIRGAGARLISSREFIQEVDRQAVMLREQFDIK